MRVFNPWLLLLAAGYWPAGANAQLQLLPAAEPQPVFAGEARKIAVVWHNAGGEVASAEIHARLYQTSSAIAVPLSEKPWKRIEILPGQTALESARMDFPDVKAGTAFLIQWLDGTNRVLGKTEVLVYPTNLLKELKTLLGENVLGVLDPNNQLKPLLKQNRVDIVDLGETSLDDFQGKLAIIGPFKSQAQMREGLAQSVRKIARNGTAVVWTQPPRAPRDKIKPSFYLVLEGKDAVVVVQPDLVANPAENPQSQLNLVYFSRLALNPEPIPLPELKTQP